MNSQNNVLIWVHGDCLDPHSPAIHTFPDAPAIFVFDDELLEQYKLSLKRIVFMYECLLEIPHIEIRRGEVAAELAEAAREHAATRIVTIDTVAPRFGLLTTKLRQQHKLSVEILEPDPFLPNLDKDEEFDLKRFSRYWNAVSERALSL